MLFQDAIAANWPQFEDNFGESVTLTPATGSPVSLIGIFSPYDASTDNTGSITENIQTASLRVKYTSAINPGDSVTARGDQYVVISASKPDGYIYMLKLERVEYSISGRSLGVG